MATAPTATSTNTTATAATGVGQQTGTESSLSNWAGPYVTEMLGRGQALASQPYQAYTGPLTAGASDVQNQAFQGLAGLTIPTEQMRAFTPTQFSAEDAQRLMNPYLTAALNPQIEEAKRQAQIQNLQNRTALTKAGAFGGGRGALMESEAQRNLMQNLAGITGKGYETAYNQAMGQFNKEQDLGLAATKNAQEFGLGALQNKLSLASNNVLLNKKASLPISINSKRNVTIRTSKCSTCSRSSKVYRFKRRLTHTRSLARCRKF